MAQGESRIRVRAALAARRLRALSLWLLVALVSAWSIAALLFDVRISWLRIPLAVLYGAAVALLCFRIRVWRWRLLGCGLCFGIVLAWWLSLRPSNVGQWQPDVSHLAYGQIDGSQVAISNFRSCDYRTELGYTCQWLTRTADLDQIRGLDLFVDYWTSPWIAHAILSFDFGGGRHVAFSIEARRKQGQTYSAVRGFFRQFTLISIVSDERDLVRLRTNYRKDEELYLFHTTATPAFARSLFLDYIQFTNHLRDHPMWYNALTSNCTTEIFTFRTMRGLPLTWSVLLNGKAPAEQYREGHLAGDGLPFKELMRRAWINPAARAAGKDPDFSTRIREGRPGFPAPEEPAAQRNSGQPGSR